MSRVYGEPVKVGVGEDGRRPALFVWRGKSYAVTSVIEHWIVNREWWQEPDPAPAHPELEFWRVEASAGRRQANTKPATQANTKPATQANTKPATQANTQANTQSRPPGTYELRRDVAADTWTLRRVAD